MENSKIEEKLNNLSHSSGVYLFKNDLDKVIYVGKAKNLKRRVKSYFQRNIEEGTKTKALVRSIHDLDFIETLSELEALILEAQLIKKYKPKYNIAYKDDKSYLYIVVRNDKIRFESRLAVVPKVIVARETDLLSKDITFGPYPSADTARFIVKVIRKALPYRDCSKAKFQRYHKLSQPCLYGHIGLCQAPCANFISLREYRQAILRIKKLLSGESVKLVRSIERGMEKASKKQDFESAAILRDTLRKFEYVRKSSRTVSKYIDNPYLVEDLINKSLDELVINLPILLSLPKRIECYDISSLSGKEATGSMVVATNGRIDKSKYRRFKVRFKEKPDDLGMIRHVLERRLKRDWEKPDLIVVDGGKGQVSAAYSIVSEMNLDIPIIGLAKRDETIVYKNNNIFDELNLDRSNEGLKLLQRLRDEAHRFARKYHHHLRLKKLTS